MPHTRLISMTMTDRTEASDGMLPLQTRPTQAVTVASPQQNTLTGLEHYVTVLPSLPEKSELVRYVQTTTSYFPSAKVGSPMLNNGQPYL